MASKPLKTTQARAAVEHWYPEYWAQTWYRNTFLVERPGQIAKSRDEDGDWNNVYDSGCNFTCIAMIVGIDPARWASMLSAQRYFLPDAELPADHLTGAVGGLVWDQNVPHPGMRSIAVENVWHPKLGRRTDITVSFMGRSSTRSYREGKRLVAAMRERGRHIICGPEEHSHLIAGTVGNDFCVWDPDDTEKSVETNLEGRFMLRDLFTEHRNKIIEFWEYRLEMT